MSNDDFIFLISDEGRLTKAPGTPYGTEEQLQELVAKNPEVLLAGDSSDDGAVRWMMVSREVGIPDTEAGSTRWAIDHVFLDQNGIPTFVEVKRSSDTRIRREVFRRISRTRLSADTFPFIRSSDQESVS